MAIKWAVRSGSIAHDDRRGEASVEASFSESR
jgi:hypothetical protein